MASSQVLPVLPVRPTEQQITDSILHTITPFEVSTTPTSTTAFTLASKTSVTNQVIDATTMDGFLTFNQSIFLVCLLAFLVAVMVVGLTVVSCQYRKMAAQLSGISMRGLKKKHSDPEVGATTIATTTSSLRSYEGSDAIEQTQSGEEDSWEYDEIDDDDKPKVLNLKSRFKIPPQAPGAKDAKKKLRGPGRPNFLELQERPNHYLPNPEAFACAYDVTIEEPQLPPRNATHSPAPPLKKHTKKRKK